MSPPGAAPEQVRLGLGTTPEEIRVAWTTGADSTGCLSNVAWGETAQLELGKSDAASSTLFTMNPGYNFTTHWASMEGLKPSTKYFYQVTTDGLSSEIFDFTTPRDQAPFTHLIFGDLGAAYAYTICPDCGSNVTCETCTNTSAGLISEVDTADMQLHLGDFAYNYDSNGGLTGDQFMRNIAQLATKTPYMVCVGNHENGDNPIAQYTERWRHMPIENSSGTIGTKNAPGNPNNWFFSFDAGLVHYVAISTEVQALAMTAYGGGYDLVKRQYEWLEQDLTKANKNRDKTPWIAVFGHRSSYCSCDADCDRAAEQLRLGPWLNGTYSLEELFFEQGVDLFINGHEHNYERNWPTYHNKTDQSNVDPKATIYIVTGSAGNEELHEPFTRPQPPRSAFRSNTFGYSKLIAHNDTHIRWQQIMTDPTFFGPDKYGKVIDDTWIVQHNHGPFSLADAPKTHEGSGLKGKSLDHWDGIIVPDFKLWEKSDGDAELAGKLPNGWKWRERANEDFLKEFSSAKWENAEAHSRRLLMRGD